MNDHEEVIRQPEGTGDPQMLVTEATYRYIASRRASRELNDRSARTIRATLHVFARIVGNPQIGKIRPKHIERWLEARPDISARSLRTQYSQVRTFLRWCVSRGYLRADPTANLRGPREPRSLPRSEPPAAIRQLLDACPDSRAQVIILLMAQEGLRCVEVSRLQVGDIDPLDHAARIVGKGGNERFLPLTHQTLQAISDYLGEYPTVSGPLLRSYMRPRDPLHPHTVSDIVGRVFRGAGLKQRAHDGHPAHALRHSALQHILLNGADIEQVREIAGHVSLATTTIYTKRSHAVNELREAMGGREY